MYKRLLGIDLTNEQQQLLEEVRQYLSDYEHAATLTKEHFFLTHVVVDNTWIQKESVSFRPYVFINRSEDGRYTLDTISTAQVVDSYGDTFTIQAMDYEVDRNMTTDFYPMYNVFHNLDLFIGRVTSMTRVGLFSIERGYSFDDKFSLDVCKNLLERNDGKWRVSRGFLALETEGLCPGCGTNLMFHYQHFLHGFSCPACLYRNTEVKGIINNMMFYKTLTYELTITDVPAVKATTVISHL